MSGKTRVLSFLLVLLLSIPFVLTPGNQGDVLGINEDKSQNSGQIAGGVAENSTEESQKMTGKIIWSNSPNSRVRTDKFNLSTPITVSTPEKSLNLIVEEKVDGLDEGVLLIVNKETFQKLGGQPDQESLEVTITKN